jgi:hypothetical protein
MMKSVTDILCNTLRRMEKTPEFRRSDAAAVELKRHVIRAIAELEVARSTQQSGNGAAIPRQLPSSPKSRNRNQLRTR